MNISLDLVAFQKIWSLAQAYFFQHVLSWSMAAQVAVIACAILLANRATRAIHAWFDRLQAQGSSVPELNGALSFLPTFKRVI